jgi:hypothetical protein
MARQNTVDGLVRTVELISGLANLGAYAVWKADGVDAAFDFLDSVRRPLEVVHRKSGSGGRLPHSQRGRPGHWLGTDDALVVPLVTTMGSVILMMTATSGQSGRQSHAVPLPTLREEAFRKYLSEWLEACQRTAMHDWRFPLSRYSDVLDKLLRKLGRSLGEPLLEALVSSGVRPDAMIAIAAVGGPSMVPFHALPIVAGECLWDRYSVSYRPWLRADRAGHQRPSAIETPRRAVLVVDPDGSLRDTADREATAVEDVLSSSGLTVERFGKDNATLRNVLSAMSGADVIHVASHGMFDWRDPQASGLYLANQQILTARAVSKAADLGGCRICMLSACETGLTDPGLRADAFVGLAGSFLDKGAQLVVASLWPVPTSAAADLASEFYRLMFTEKMDPARSLRRAALSMRNPALRQNQATTNALTVAWAAFAAFGNAPADCGRHGRHRQVWGSVAHTD